MGTPPLGSLVAGGGAAHLGALLTVRIGGVGYLIAAIVFARYLPTLRAMVRPIYTNLGLIHAATLQSQTAIESCLHGHH